MSTATLDYQAVVASDDDAIQYRAIHSGAIVGLVTAIFTFGATLLAWGSVPDVIYIAALSAVPLSLCMWSYAKIRRERELYTGAGIAMLGLVLSLVSLIGGVSYGSYVYATEVPEGYTRISFNEMKPDELQERSGLAVPPEIAALDGKKVFIKGYIRPDSITVSRGVKDFLLVRDNNQCCFGDASQVKYYDQIMVSMAGSRTVDYSEGIFRMGGVLNVEPRNLAPGSRKPVFSLTADHAN